MTQRTTTEGRLLLHVEGCYYLRPLGYGDYGDEDRHHGRFELVWVDDDARPYPTGRSLSKNNIGILEVKRVNGDARFYDKAITNDRLNEIADAARRLLISQGW